jgi:hypothetical protein
VQKIPYRKAMKSIDRGNVVESLNVRRAEPLITYKACKMPLEELPQRYTIEIQKHTPPKLSY